MSSRMPWWRSIRVRIAVALALTAVVVALVLSVVVDRGTMLNGRDRLRDQAVDQLSTATAAYDFANSLLPGASLGTHGVPRELTEAVRPDAVSTYFDGRTMWAARRVGDQEQLVVSLSADSLTHQRHDLHRSLLLAGIVVLLLAGVGGWLLAGTLTSRLRGAARWVEEGAEPGSGPSVAARDEVGELVGRIEELSGVLRERVRTEQAFTADVAHELRTPLTALVSATELLPPEDEATALVRRQTRRLRRLVDDLLELARADAGADSVSSESLSLAELVRGVAEELPEAAPDILEEVAPMPVRADRRRTERVVANLLANAQRHGARPVRVRIRGTELELRDAGPGFPDAVLTEGPQRFRSYGRGAGSGLGLTIAELYCRQMGVSLRLANGEGDGALVRMGFPDAQGSGRVE